MSVLEKHIFHTYNELETYLAGKGFNFGTNKRLKFIYRSAEDFYIIDFSSDTKGNIINCLTFNETTAGKIEGFIEYPNIKKQFQNEKHLPLFCNGLLEEDEPLLYKHFCIYIKT